MTARFYVCEGEEERHFDNMDHSEAAGDNWQNEARGVWSSGQKRRAEQRGNAVTEVTECSR